MCHNVHNPKTQYVVLLAPCQVFFTSAMAKDGTSNSTPPLSRVCSPLNLSLAPILAPEANTDQL